MKSEEAQFGWRDTVPMPIQLRPVTEDREVFATDGTSGTGGRCGEVDDVEVAVGAGGIGQIGQFWKANEADWIATTRGSAGHRQRQTAGKVSGELPLGKG